MLILFLKTSAVSCAMQNWLLMFWEKGLAMDTQQELTLQNLNVLGDL